MPSPANPMERCRVLYVSPLKALTYDVERNLRAPLAGMGASGIRVGTRTGDTTEKERRSLRKEPPDILITTPESLYLMLTSGARDILASIEHVIIDEIHAVAATKRGAHLALSLERLDRLCAAADASGSRHLGRQPQRIGLSATQRPLDELARFLGGIDKKVSIVDAGVRKQLDLEVIVPVEDMGELGRFQPAGGDTTPEVRTSIWPSIHPILLALIRSHRSTLIFVNARGTAERLASRLNELAEEELVRAHHGSIAREQRVEIEDALKAGKLPALVATSSLELGIDMGAIDLVVQVEAPSSVASGLQRIGRAGHQVGEPSKGKIFPKFRGDLIVAAVTAQRMQAGLIEETHVPRNPLDVLAQQIVAMVAIDEPLAVDEVYETVTRAYPFSDLTRDAFENVLDMLAGRYPSDEFAEFRPRVVWDRVEGTLTARPGSRMLAIISGGTIPRPRVVRCLHAGWKPGWRTRRGDGLREPGGRDLPVGGDHLADRGDHATASSSRPRRASPASCRSGTATRSAGRTNSGARSASSCARSRTPPTRSCATSTRSIHSRSPTCAGISKRNASPRAARSRPIARSSSSATATSWATGVSACSRPSAHACTRRGVWPSRPLCAIGSASRCRRSGAMTAS